jgi:hypothetical protein
MCSQQIPTHKTTPLTTADVLEYVFEPVVLQQMEQYLHLAMYVRLLHLNIIEIFRGYASGIFGSHMISNSLVSIFKTQHVKCLRESKCEWFCGSFWYLIFLYRSYDDFPECWERSCNLDKRQVGVSETAEETD